MTHLPVQEGTCACKLAVQECNHHRTRAMLPRHISSRCQQCLQQRWVIPWGHRRQLQRRRLVQGQRSLQRRSCGRRRCRRRKRNGAGRRQCGNECSGRRGLEVRSKCAEYVQRGRPMHLRLTAAMRGAHIRQP